VQESEREGYGVYITHGIPLANRRHRGIRDFSSPDRVGARHFALLLPSSIGMRVTLVIVIVNVVVIIVVIVVVIVVVVVVVVVVMIGRHGTFCLKWRSADSETCAVSGEKQFVRIPRVMRMILLFYKVIREFRMQTKLSIDP